MDKKLYVARSYKKFCTHAHINLQRHVLIIRCTLFTLNHCCQVLPIIFSGISFSHIFFFFSSGFVHVQPITPKNIVVWKKSAHFLFFLGAIIVITLQINLIMSVCYITNCPKKIAKRDAILLSKMMMKGRRYQQNSEEK